MRARAPERLFRIEKQRPRSQEQMFSHGSNKRCDVNFESPCSAIRNFNNVLGEVREITSRFHRVAILPLLKTTRVEFSRNDFTPNLFRFAPESEGKILISGELRVTAAHGETRAHAGNTRTCFFYFTHLWKFTCEEGPRSAKCSSCAARATPLLI